MDQADKRLALALTPPSASAVRRCPPRRLWLGVRLRPIGCSRPTPTGHPPIGGDQPTNPLHHILHSLGLGVAAQKAWFAGVVVLAVLGTTFAALGIFAQS
jgi:hypothetical protein